MSASTLVTIMCDECGWWSDAGIGSTAAKARAGLRGKWRFDFDGVSHTSKWELGKPGGIDICPRCVLGLPLDGSLVYY